MATPRTIQPGEGVDGFRLGMTRPELWALTRSHVLSFVRGDATEREDDFQQHGVCVEYRDGRAASFTVFARMASGELAPIVVLDDDVAGYTRDDVVTLLELHGLARVDGYEEIVVPILGLTFWFREGAEEREVVEFVRVERTEPG